MDRKKGLKLRTGFLLAYFLLTIPFCAAAQQVPDHLKMEKMTKQIPTELPQTNDDTSTEQEGRWHIGLEIAFGISVLIFGAITIAIETHFLKTRPNWDASWFLKITGLTLVLTAGLFVIVAGFSQNQMAPMMALLGTVAGYLLGKETKSSATE